MLHREGETLVCKIGYLLNCGCNYDRAGWFLSRGFPLGISYNNRGSIHLFSFPYLIQWNPGDSNHSRGIKFSFIEREGGCTVGDRGGDGCVQQACQVGAAEKRVWSTVTNHREVIVQYWAMAMKITNIIPECLGEIFPGQGQVSAVLCKGPVIWRLLGHGVIFSFVISCLQKTCPGCTAWTRNKWCI